MAFWAAIPMLASMGSQALGQYQAGESAIAGAESNEKIQEMNREYQARVFKQSMEKQKPFFEAGRGAVEPYSEAIAGRGKAMEGGLAQMQHDMLKEDTGSMSEYVKNLTMGRLEAEEGEKYKGRLMDLQQIGLGSAGSAGSSAVNLGSAMSRSYANAGNANIAASMNKQTSLSNMWTQTMDSLSGLPAYYAASQQGNKTPQKTNTLGYNNPMGTRTQPYNNNTMYS